MNTIKSVFFHKNASSPEVSQPIGNVNFGSQITIEVSGAETIQLNVQGTCNTYDDTNDWHDLAVIDAKSLSVKDSIAEPGVYYVGVDGLSKIRTNLKSTSGEVTVFGVIQG